MIPIYFPPLAASAMLPLPSERPELLEGGEELTTAQSLKRSGSVRPVSRIILRSIIKDVAEKLQKSGVIDRGWMGVEVRKFRWRR
jgi:hypothetical protein